MLHERNLNQMEGNVKKEGGNKAVHAKKADEWSTFFYSLAYSSWL